VKENEKILKTLPPPPVARAYYTGADLYQFDEFQVRRVLRPFIHFESDFIFIAGVKSTGNETTSL
jgi:hypothetical protein